LFILDENGKINKIRRAANKAITPPSLLGIERRIAYTQRKYHSGAMCTGVTNGLASKKFSGSVIRFGAKRIMIINRNIAIIYPNMSFTE
jgi:hypothetical protein